ncbi:MAG: hypothetical protein HY263_01215 [Chloroflexi bacterium]|nr:hypothetical protein [Chloroflexota bacterium]
MSGPTNLDPLLIAIWANESRIAAKGGAEAERAHIAEDRDAAVERGRLAPSRSPAVLVRIRRRLGRR